MRIRLVGVVLALALVVVAAPVAAEGVDDGTPDSDEGTSMSMAWDPGQGCRPQCFEASRDP